MLHTDGVNCTVQAQARVAKTSTVMTTCVLNMASLQPSTQGLRWFSGLPSCMHNFSLIQRAELNLGWL